MSALRGRVTAMTERRHRAPLHRSFYHAFEGLAFAIRSQRNMKIHLICALLVILGGLLIRLNLVEWALVALCIGLVIACELINTALEALVDLASPEIHPKAKVAKDAAAAAVLAAAAAAAVIGVLVSISAIGRLLS
jgi:diacylglycerol kinase